MKLANSDLLHGDDDGAQIRNVLSQKLDLQVKANSTVAFVKEKVENELRKLLPATLALDIVELRIGERLSLPSTGKLA